MLLKLFAARFILFITFPVARLCFTIFQHVFSFLDESEADFGSELKTSIDEEVERLLDV